MLPKKWKFMQRLVMPLFIALLILAVSGCRVDELSPCDGEIGVPGLLCKEYRFLDNEPIGSLSYYYDKDGILNRVDYNATNGDLKKYVLYINDGDDLMKEISHDPDGKKLEEIVYGYNEENSIASIDTIEDDIKVSNRVFEYQNSILQRENYYKDEILDSYLTYEYHDDGTLFKTRHYRGDGSLKMYMTHEYYDNYITRYRYYTASHIYLGYDLERRNSNEQVIRFTSYGPNSNILNYTEYKYNELYQLAEEVNFDEEEKPVSNIIYKYHLN